MKRPSAFLTLTALTLVCWLSVPSTSYAQWGGWGGWGGWGPGMYGWGGYGMGGWGGGLFGYPAYAGAYSRPYTYTPSMGSYYASPSYYAALPNYTARTAPVEAMVITTVSTAGAARENPGTRADRAHIYVEVPENAQVLFDNTPMHQQGARRRFKTPPLQPNATGYIYEVTARWTENGKEHREKRTVHVTPGGTSDVNFLADQDRVVPASGEAALRQAPGESKK